MVRYMQVVATTVGYGDQDPLTSDGTRIFTCLFAFFGVAVVLGVGSYLVVQLLEDRKRRRLARQRTRKRKLLKKASRLQSGFRKGFAAGRKGLHAAKRLSAKVLAPAAPVAKRIGRMFRVCSSLKWPFVYMIVTWAVWILFFMFHGDEDLSFVESLYFAVISGTTVGFGDFSPQTSDGRAFVTVWLIVLVVTTTSFLGAFSSEVVPKPEDTQLMDLFREGPNSIYKLSVKHNSEEPMSYSDWYVMSFASHLLQSHPPLTSALCDPSLQAGDTCTRDG